MWNILVKELAGGNSPTNGVDLVKAEVVGEGCASGTASFELFGKVGPRSVVYHVSFNQMKGQLLYSGIDLVCWKLKRTING